MIGFEATPVARNFIHIFSFLFLRVDWMTVSLSVEAMNSMDAMNVMQTIPNPASDLSLNPPDVTTTANGMPTTPAGSQPDLNAGRVLNVGPLSTTTRQQPLASQPEDNNVNTQPASSSTDSILRSTASNLNRMS